MASCPAAGTCQQSVAADPVRLGQEYTSHRKQLKNPLSQKIPLNFQASRIYPSTALLGLTQLPKSHTYAHSLSLPPQGVSLATKKEPFEQPTG